MGGTETGVSQRYLYRDIMIFASLGTMDMPFERMAKAIDEWASQSEEEVIVQTGHTPYPYRHAKAFRFCTKEEMKRYMEQASMVILQGGWGAISEAMEMKKRIVVMPRHNHTEHIHDQFQLVRKLDSMGCIVGVFHEKDLPDKMEQARNHIFQPLQKGNAESLIENKLREWFEL